MTEAEHRNLYREHNANAREALHRFVNDMNDRASWEEYLSERKLANKHYGIANAMWTKSMKKLNYIWG